MQSALRQLRPLQDTPVVVVAAVVPAAEQKHSIAPRNSQPLVSVFALVVAPVSVSVAVLATLCAKPMHD